MLHNSLNDCVQALQDALQDIKITPHEEPTKEHNESIINESPLDLILAMRPAGLPSSHNRGTVIYPDWWGPFTSSEPVNNPGIYLFNFSEKETTGSRGVYSNDRSKVAPISSSFTTSTATPLFQGVSLINRINSKTKYSNKQIR
jgi:hypothetical protein